MWLDLMRAAALMLVLEGILPFLAPASSKEAYIRLAGLPDRWLRGAGLAAMLAGLVLLQWIHWAS
ncbi:DUF2065 family protein [Nevskia sp.]|uniref:DUF2065 domain-containing protein n=1 Tax=Nevskia sp. TaxID=1929292 RepID=UPI0025CEE175|nr:DUF2065 family protein [Nevskia sp.]